MVKAKLGTIGTVMDREGPLAFRVEVMDGEGRTADSTKADQGDGS